MGLPAREPHLALKWTCSATSWPDISKDYIQSASTLCKLQRLKVYVW
jgi:hypothetical protein